jgi:hypothetical protein
MLLWTSIYAYFTSNFRFYHPTFVILSPSIRAIHPANLFFLDSIARIIICEQQQLWSCSYDFFHYSLHYCCNIYLIYTGGGGDLLAADGQSTNSSWYRALLPGPWPDFIFILSFDIYFVVLPAARPLWREDGSVTCSAIGDLSGHWGPITIHHRLIWDCVPFSSPPTTRRDYGGGSIALLHTGNLYRLNSSKHI